MKVLVCGGRYYHNVPYMRKVMNAVHDTLGVTAVIHGDQRGADKLAGVWAGGKGLKVVPFPAEWKRFGRGAGMIRNTRMLKEGCPDLVVAFPGGSGTADMVRKARTAGVPVLDCREQFDELALDAIYYQSNLTEETQHGNEQIS